MHGLLLDVSFNNHTLANLAQILVLLYVLAQTFTFEQF